VIFHDALPSGGELGNPRCGRSPGQQWAGAAVFIEPSKMQNEKILTLRTQVKAADEEFHIALAFHEAWKPAAYDKALHDRIGLSYAAHTFGVNAAGLRREMLLALMRLCNDDPRSAHMKLIGETLQDLQIVDALVAEVAHQRDQPIDPSTVEDFPEEDRPRCSKLSAGPRQITDAGPPRRDGN
jgi:hypothetical protein